jgi:hypothetical protein
MPSRSRASFERVLAEPGRFWLCHAPTRWPGPDGEWLNLARNRLAGAALRSPGPLPPGPSGLDDVVYLPPVDPAAALARQHFAEVCAGEGLPVVVQMLPGESPPAMAGTLVLDLTDSLLRGQVEAIECPPGAWCLWPLIPGLTDAASVVSSGLERLAAGAAGGVRPAVPELAAETRRRLAVGYGRRSTYGELFHRGETAEREFMRAAARLGLAVQPPRPGPARGAAQGNRRLATHFATLADLWLTCGRPEGRAQEFFRASRRLAEEPADVEELCRRGGLGTVEWLDDPARLEIEQLVQRSAATDLERELRRELGSEQAG